MEQNELDNPELYINRELSHLEFNRRVLDQAVDTSHPLLERLKFLLIFSSNLDEFFEIRVAGLKQQVRFAREMLDADGMPPSQVLAEISRIVHEEVDHQYHIFNEQLLPALEKEKVRFIKRDEWSEQQEAWISEYFEQEIRPVINPLGLDPAHPFPRLVNKSLNFIVELEGKDAFGRDSGMSIVPAPRSLPRAIRIPDELCKDGDNYVFLSAIIHHHVSDLFPGMEAKGCYQFRLTRDADMQLADDEVEDIAHALKGELISRRFGSAVRLEVSDDCPQNLIEFLLMQFNLDRDSLYCVNGPVNLGRMMDVLSSIERHDLCYLPHTPNLPKKLSAKKDLFDAISKEDFLLHHPYESFTPIVDLLHQAAKDPDVLAIKQTLYRTGSSSEVVDALVEAARNGKEVVAVIELRARFDEEENLEFASRLQEAGALVVYGVVGYKTHAKMMLIVRREKNKLRRYTHLGTGNYHAGNARLYTDYSLLTANKEVGNDVQKIFQQLTGMGKNVRCKKLFHAPFTLKKNVLQLIEKETLAAQGGKPARIIAKMNSLTDPKIIQALYKASNAGVQIDMVVRGMCCLRPGVKGFSSNIKIRSIIGRFLEHSRVFYFHNNEQQVYLASADMRERNLNRRVEAFFPIENPKLARRVKKELELFLADNSQSWELQSDGSYKRNAPRARSKVQSVQQQLMENYSL